MTKWRPDPDALPRPAYLSLAAQIRNAIETGQLPPGTRLATHREMAFDIGISVQTVSRAYDELASRGLIEGEVGRGTFVRGPAAVTKTPFSAERSGDGLIDLSILKPVADDLHRQHMAEALRAISARLSVDMLFAFRPDAAFLGHQQRMLGWLARCGVEATAESIVLTNGVTPGLNVALMTVARAGGTIVTERIGHHPLMPLASSLGIRVVGADIDDQGILPGAFERACREHNAMALFTIPTVCNPCVTVMSADRRRDIVEIATRHSVWIVENDAFGPLVADKPAPLHALAPERTLYVTSFSKCVMPALRLGCLLVPSALITPVRNRHLVTNWMATPLMAEIAALWIETGIAEELVAWQRQALADRHAMAVEALKGLTFSSHPQAQHLWLSLPEPWREDQFQAEARRRGVAVAAAGPFRVENDDTDTQAIRISLGSSSASDLRRGLDILHDLVADEPEVAGLAL